MLKHHKPGGGGVSLGKSAQGDVFPGVSALGGVYPKGVHPQLHTEIHPTCEQNDQQTGVKTLPCPKLRLKVPPDDSGIRVWERVRRRGYDSNVFASPVF